MKKKGIKGDIKLENNDPLLQLIGKVGELTGLIKGLDKKMDDIKKEQDRFIGRDTCENIVNAVMTHHLETSHRKNSRPPSAPLLTAKQKKILIGALSTIATAVAAFLTAKYGV